MSRRRWSDKKPRGLPGRAPYFHSGVLPEPLISFGGQHRHVDPKIGLGLYGPYSLVGQSDPTISTIVVGIVGPPAMVADAEQWLQACRGVLLNDGQQPFLYPHFPGVRRGHPFQFDFQFGDTWRESLRDKDIADILLIPSFEERIKRLVNLYAGAVEVLANRDPKPNVILCCIPQDVIDYCTVKRTRSGEVKRVKITSWEKHAVDSIRAGQQFLFPELTPTLGIEDEQVGHQNFRRGLKAEVMRFGIPTQLVWPRTLRLIDIEPAPGEQGAQDIATRAWNFVTAMYHKAGGSPWRLAEIEQNVCFVGVSFYRELGPGSPTVRTTMAQAFTSAGDGYVLRGESFDWDESQRGKSPHLDETGAANLMRDVLELYQRQNRGSLPGRVVVHKSSRFWDEELAGFEAACKLVPRADFVALGWRGIQFYRPGDYPPLRGTYVKFSDDDLLLYTVGYIPFLRTYPGARVPHPIEIIERHGDSPWNVVLSEILALTKMNWNTAGFACSEPITLAFARRVGQILAELPANLEPRSEYRYYM